VTQTGHIQTVLGLIPPDELGPTMTHEHVLSDLSGIGGPPDDPFERKIYYEPVSLENVGYLRYYGMGNEDSMRLDDIDTAVDELSLYKQHGGGGIVEVSSIGLHRDPKGLAEVSRRTGVHIVMGASYYVKEAHPPDMDAKSEDEIFEEIVSDITIGVDGTEIKSGVIGEVGCSYPLSDSERKVLRASARAQRATGAAILIHPGRDEPSPEEIMGVIDGAGGDLGRTIIGHLERTVMDRNILLRIAEAGCYLEWDHFSTGQAYYPPNLRIDMLNDIGRIDVIRFMIEHGYGDKVLVAHDVASKPRLIKYGGHGYFYILKYVIPRMRERGYTEDEIDALVTHNPATALTFVEPQP